MTTLLSRPSGMHELQGAGPSKESRFCAAGEIRILVVDDDQAIGRLISASLAGRDFHVAVVSHSEQVEEYLKQPPFHLIILDYVLPGLDSGQVFDWVRTYQPDASIIVITGFPSMDSALNCLRAHTYDYITKPFQVEQLQQTVMRCLESRGQMRLSEEALLDQLGAAIRQRRKAQGLTLAQLAKRTNVSLGYLSQIELGKNSASIETLYRIALGLRIRLADLFQSLQPNF